MLDELKAAVLDANLQLVREGLVIQTWGNASGVDRSSGLMVIKPSGVSYAKMQAEHMVTVRLDTGEVIDSKLNPSSDTATHLALYRAFPNIGGVVHTHSLYATAWAQACKSIPAFGTTHADYFYGAVPCTRQMKPEEIKEAYEANTGAVIVETFANKDPMSCPGVLVASHAPFTWGKTPVDAVHNAVVLENVAKLALETLRIDAATPSMQQVLLDKHFLRKHGPGAYYGQAGGQK